MRALAAIVAVGALAPAAFGMQQQSARASASAGSKTIASGKPLVYAEVFQNGKAQLFVARSCDQ